MEDGRIVELYWQRAENAIAETAKKYGQYCASIAYNILNSTEDAEECVNDTWLGAWNSMPPHRPNVLSVFLGKITRRAAIGKYRVRTAAKRNGGQVPLVLEELSECTVGMRSAEEEAEGRELVRTINTFLAALPDTERGVFLCRYWYMDSIEAIAVRFGFSKSKVASMLYRLRERLRGQLEKEGYR